MYVPFPDPIIFHNWELTASLAIWNMKKMIIAIATGTWGAGVVFQIQSKPLFPFGERLEINFKRAILAIVRVNNQPDL